MRVCLVECVHQIPTRFTLDQPQGGRTPYALPIGLLRAMGKGGRRRRFDTYKSRYQYRHLDTYKSRRVVVSSGLSVAICFQYRVSLDNLVFQAAGLSGEGCTRGQTRV